MLSNGFYYEIIELLIVVQNILKNVANIKQL